jgi:hypothetical protein
MEQLPKGIYWTTPGDIFKRVAPLTTKRQRFWNKSEELKT